MSFIIQQLKALKRYRYMACEDDDGSLDEWKEEDPNGEWVRFSDVAKIIKELESINSPSLEVEVIRGHITEEYAVELEQLRAAIKP